jgi:excisionase family DNA binding protein
MNTNQTELLTVAEVAALCRLRVPTIYSYVENRRLPHLKIGSRVLFERAVLDDWLQSHRVEPVGAA